MGIVFMLREHMSAGVFQTPSASPYQFYRRYSLCVIVMGKKVKTMMVNNFTTKRTTNYHPKIIEHEK